MSSELELLEIAIIGELEARIIELGDNPDTAMSDIQPPTSIARAAAVAAAQVLMAFERGYQMAPEEIPILTPGEGAPTLEAVISALIDELTPDIGTRFSLNTTFPTTTREQEYVKGWNAAREKIANVLRAARPEPGA